MASAAPSATPGRVAIWVIRLAALLAFCGTGYLAWASWSSGAGEMIGCGFSQIVDCQHVLNSRWSRWLGAPVSWGGLLIYGALFAASMFAGPNSSPGLRRTAWRALVVLAAVAAGAALWFFYVQAMLLGSLCPWCMAVHLCGLVLAATAFIARPLRIESVADRQTGAVLQQTLGIRQASPDVLQMDAPLLGRATKAWALIGGGAATAVLIVGQLAWSPGMVVELADLPPQPAPQSIPEPTEQSPTDEPSSTRGTADVNHAPEADQSEPAAVTADEPTPRDEAEPKEIGPPVDSAVAAPDSAAQLTMPPTDPPEIDTANDGTADVDALAPPLDTTPDAVDEAAPAEERTELVILPQNDDGSDANDEPDSAHVEADVVPPSDEDPLPATAPLEPVRWNRQLAVYNGRQQLDLDEQVFTGKVGARYVIVTLFDYTCSHCRQMHEVMNMARQRYGDQLAIVHVPAPLNTSCNPYVTQTHRDHRDACYLARLGLAVWRARPAAFAEYDDWMFQSPRSRNEARAKAVEVIGGPQLNSALADPWISRHLRSCVRLLQDSGNTGLPVTLIGRRTAKGHETSATKTAAVVFGVIESELGIAPVGR